MSNVKVGERVGAILDSDDKTVRLFGFGTYEGDEIPPDLNDDFSSCFHSEGICNPKIKLDSGQIVWGFECWWGPEANIVKMIGNREVVHVDVDARRADIEARQIKLIQETKEREKDRCEKLYEDVVEVLKQYAPESAEGPYAHGIKTFIRDVLMPQIEKLNPERKGDGVD